MWDVLRHQIKKVSQLEAEVVDLKHTNNMQLKIHQVDVESYRAEVQRRTTQLEAKDAFCEAEKNHVLAELQADYQSKLPVLYDEQYDLGY